MVGKVVFDTDDAGTVELVLENDGTLHCERLPEVAQMLQGELADYAQHQYRASDGRFGVRLLYRWADLLDGKVELSKMPETPSGTIF